MQSCPIFQPRLVRCCCFSFFGCYIGEEDGDDHWAAVRDICLVDGRIHASPGLRENVR
jgi:hypothetical protein